MNAKNNLHNCYDYNPNQLVFRHNPTAPSFLVIDLLLQGKKHQVSYVMYRSRKAFINGKSNENLLTAIRSTLGHDLLNIWPYMAHLKAKIKRPVFRKLSVMN